MSRTVTVAACVLLLAAVASACDDTDTADPQAVEARSAALPLPSDLCSLVPDSYTGPWRLSGTGHTTTNSRDVASAQCSMSGQRAGAPVSLTATAVMFGDTADADAEQRTASALEAACRELAGTARGDLETDEFGCRVTATGQNAQTRGYVLDISRLGGGAGMLRVEMVHHGDAWMSVAPDVAGIAGSILSAVGAG